MKNFLRFIAQIGLKPGDSPDIILQKRSVVYQALLMSVGGLIWGILALSIHLKWQSVIPFGYVLLSTLNLAFFHHTRHFQVVKNFQTMISLALPFMFQCALGGFVASGAVMLWALLSLTIAVLYQSNLATYLWLILYVLLTVISGVYDHQVIQWLGLPASAQYSILFFVLNISVISTIILWLVNFMYWQKNAAMQKLEETRMQLVQTEKLAALGELTAGIAHEIKNPLNFVNNFSELNKELLAEMESHLDTGHFNELKSIVQNIAENEEKIAYHGKRADSIVNSMLQHSRSSSEKKELVDINVLADEFVRLAYHGLRAKDKSFSADFKTDLDPNLPKIEVIPQDIGRVFLNLINNAFYAVFEKQKLNYPDYRPTVIVATRNMTHHIEIRVKDNGMGIPQRVLDKIFQPFFTTKPTGQGTGLGLSMSYDIITKGHGGELKVETQEGKYSEFIISLPLKTPKNSI